jgi:calcium and integrin-binding protein 1
MGGTPSTLSEEDLELYQECTYFTRTEIVKAHKRFLDLMHRWRGPDAKAKDPAERIPMEEVGSRPARWACFRSADGRCPVPQLVKMEELAVNPFRERICRVFSESGKRLTTGDPRPAGAGPSKCLPAAP